MTDKDAKEMILAGFACLSSSQRKVMLKFLKMSMGRLNFGYPNGIPEAILEHLSDPPKP